MVCQSAPFKTHIRGDQNVLQKWIDNYLALHPDDQLAISESNEDSEFYPRHEQINDSDGYTMSKRDALWTTTEVLDCIRRLKLYKDVSKLDLAAEMLNCYRRLRHSG